MIGAVKVWGKSIRQQPMIIIAKTPKMMVTPHRVIHDGIVPSISWTGSLYELRLILDLFFFSIIMEPLVQHIHYGLVGFCVTGFIELAEIPLKCNEGMTAELVTLDVLYIITSGDMTRVTGTVQDIV